MKFETSKLTKVIEQNYSHLMPDFFEMQTEYLVSLNIIYSDLDASLIAKKASTLMGGGGGGRPESAQGGGRNPNKLPEVLSEIPNIIAAITNDRKS